MPESPDAPLERMGVRNYEHIGGFTFLPTGVIADPLIQGIVPEFGDELGNNTVIIHGQEFDAFSVDLSNENDPGIGIECPPDSDRYIAPLSATLVDRNTIVVVMPPCPVDIPETVNFSVRNKFSMDRAPFAGGVGPNMDRVVFEDIYTYEPIPPILPPVITAIHPAGEGPQPQGMGNDYGGSLRYIKSST